MDLVDTLLEPASDDGGGEDEEPHESDGDHVPQVAAVEAASCFPTIRIGTGHRGLGHQVI